MACSLACLGYAETSANAGWFDPNDYDECVLEKMKGQPVQMVDIAVEYCALKFPCNAKFKEDFLSCLYRSYSPGGNYCLQASRQYCNQN